MHIHIHIHIIYICVCVRACVSIPNFSLFRGNMVISHYEAWDFESYLGHGPSVCIRLTSDDRLGKFTKTDVPSLVSVGFVQKRIDGNSMYIYIKHLSTHTYIL